MDGCIAAGASKRAISPHKNLFPLPQRENKYYDRVYEEIYVRALNVQASGKSWVIISFDLFGMPFWSRLRENISLKLGIPDKCIILCDTYNHCAPREDLYRFDVSHCGGDVLERTEAYFDFCRSCAEEVAQEAVASAVPAYAVVKTGTSPVCMNRDEEDNGLWLLGKNPFGPRDWQYTFVQWLRAEDGNVIADLVSYPLYGNMCYLAAVERKTQLGCGGDFPGRICELLELKDSAPCLWLCGAAGDQDPLFLSSYTDWSGPERKFFSLDNRQVMELRELQAQWMLGNLLHPADVKRIRRLDRVDSRAGEVAVPRRGASGETVIASFTLIRTDFEWILFISGAPVCAMGNKIKALFRGERCHLVTHAGPFTGYLVCAEENRPTFAARNMIVNLGDYEKEVFPAIFQAAEELGMGR